MVAPGIEEGLVDGPSYEMFIDYILHICLFDSKHFIEGILAVLKEELSFSWNI